MAAILDEYERRRDSGTIRPDAAQRPVIAKLDALAEQLKNTAPSGLFAKLKKPPPPPKGLYIHGEVGRGKTMVMDLFHDVVDVAPKRRVHFHAFMQDVHKRLHAARQSQTQDAIAPVAKALAKEARLLCLDEMQITDIADAMIIGRLFEGLLAHGTVIVTPSNLAPDQLYRNGLNRQLFLPFIALIKDKLDVISLDSRRTTGWDASRRMRPSSPPSRPKPMLACRTSGSASPTRRRASPWTWTCWAASCTCRRPPWLRPLQLPRTLREAAGPAGLPGTGPDFQILFLEHIPR